MRQPRVPSVAWLATLGAATMLLSACTPDVTAPRVSASFDVTFTRLYHLQLADEGKRLPPPLARARPDGSIGRGVSYSHATCHKGNRTTNSQTGAGDNWVCTESFERPDLTVGIADYDVSVRTDGCFVAVGPQQVIGPPEIMTPGGGFVTNPLSEFDGCFPT